VVASVVAILSGPWALAVLAAAYFSFVIGERMFYWARGLSYNTADAGCSIALNLTNSVFNLVLGILVPFTAYVYVWNEWRLIDNMALLVALPIAFVWHDVMYYAAHRLSHRVGLLWALHSVHHSSNEFNHTVAARGTVLDALSDVHWHLPAALLGVPPPAYLAVTVCKQIFGLWNHASYVRHLGWAEQVLCTPLNHKIHHANQSEYIDMNYGQVLLVWDRLFGTRATFGAEPVPGLVKPVENSNPLKAQVTGWAWLIGRMAGAERWQEKLAYLWRPPEWSHDGTCRSNCPKYAPSAVLA
jgi:sterol desaturase/sphingolipid hydroxylase (fatty acid hydroxylase superfamily)